MAPYTVTSKDYRRMATDYPHLSRAEIKEVVDAALILMSLRDSKEDVVADGSITPSDCDTLVADDYGNDVDQPQGGNEAPLDSSSTTYTTSPSSSSSGTIVLTSDRDQLQSNGSSAEPVGLPSTSRPGQRRSAAKQSSAASKGMTRGNR